MDSDSSAKLAPAVLGRSVAREGGGWALWAELVKARLNSLVLLTTLVGFYLAHPGPVNWIGLAHVLIGVGLLAAGGGALNQWMEREQDGRMPRTQHRPLPSGRIQPQTALLVGSGLAAAGLGYLVWATYPLAALLGGLTLASYLLLYTPLKRKVWWNTWVGALPGALPPVIGWAAAQGELAPGAWSLFGIVACWQMPHFFGIAWMYREEYARAGFCMLPQVDPTGVRTARQAVFWTLLLLPVSLGPWWAKLTGPLYLAAAVGLGLAYIAAAVQFARSRSDRAARGLFLASILYLPVLLVFLVLDKAGMRF